MITASVISEMAIASDYLELEQLRYGSRLRFEFRLPNDCDRNFLPILMLQPLVENAVKHGVAPAVEGGEVLIEICSEGDGYRLKVENSGSPLKQQLAIGGLLVIPVGEEVQYMYRYTRLSEMEFKEEMFDAFRFVPFLEVVRKSDK